MKKTISFVLALAFAATAAPAISKNQPIVVSAASVEAKVSRDLDRQLENAARTARYDHGDGYAMVRFTRGADGRPENISFYRRSGVSGVDRLARTAVKRLGLNGGLPDTGVANQPFQANIVLATSQPAFERLAADLGRAERQRLASSAGERAVVAVSGGSRTAS
jgi:TonB family protein